MPLEHLLSFLYFLRLLKLYKYLHDVFILFDAYRVLLESLFSNLFKSLYGNFMQMYVIC